MNDDFRILFVDDEETFLYSTADLLRREGYACDCVTHVSETPPLLQQHAYDLVIADIRMPGNDDLEFVQTLSRLREGLSIILVTAHPSVASAIQSVELPVVAYLIKPFNFHDLVVRVRAAAQLAGVGRLVRDELSRLRAYEQDLSGVAASMRNMPRVAQGQSLQAFVGLACRNIVGTLSSLQGLIADSDEPSIDTVPPFPAAMPSDLRAVLYETVVTLERSKNAFRSKELGELRKRLEALLKT